MKYFTALALLIFSAPLLATKLTISSPDGKINFILSDNKQLNYQVNFNGQAVINPSKLGFTLEKTPAFGEGFTIAAHRINNHQSSWQQPWGERQTVIDHHNQLTATLEKDGYQFELQIRVFNDGLGFRYKLPEQAKLPAGLAVNIIDEATEFVVAEHHNTTAWWIPARGWNRYEYTYTTSSIDKIDRVHTPFTFKNAQGVHVSIHEAALVDYAAMTLDQRRGGVLKADLTPWSDGTLVKTRAGFTTPWRTIQISDNAVGLLNSDLILNLNEPNKLGDVSWVEPGKYIGIWWGMHIGENTWGSGEKHGATTSETKRYMDFAASYGFDGVLVEGWNIGWDGDWFFNGDVFNFSQAYDDFDIKAITDYGRKQGVRLIGHHETSGNVTNYRNQMTAAYDLYQQQGVRQVKTGYVADGGMIKRLDDNGHARFEWHDGQFMVNEYLHSITEAAKRKISINTHEPVKDTGLRRTYPNWLSREGARGQEFNAWGTPPNPPEHTAILPFTRLLAGPMDFTPGIFDMGFNGLDGENRPRTTLAKQLALYVVLYSPIQMAADLPRNYLAKPEAFKFIQDVPTDWHQSKAISGEVGDYVVFARQDKHSPDWYIGGLSDENARELEVKLDFLSAGTTYQAQIYRDGQQAHWLDKPYDILIEQRNVTANQSLTIKLAASGGFAIRLKAL
jgi:alpha-glucosidase